MWIIFIQIKENRAGVPPTVLLMSLEIVQLLYPRVLRVFVCSFKTLSPNQYVAINLKQRHGYTRLGIKVQFKSYFTLHEAEVELCFSSSNPGVYARGFWVDRAETRRHSSLLLCRFLPIIKITGLYRYFIIVYQIFESHNNFVQLHLRLGWQRINKWLLITRTWR